MTAVFYVGDAKTVLESLPNDSVSCVVSSPPYWDTRDYEVEGQIGQEPTVDEYVEAIVAVFREVRRVLTPRGTAWLVMGDTFASAWPCRRRNVVGQGSLANGKRSARPPRLGDGLKEKDLVGVPWRVALALQADGWTLRSDVIWEKTNPPREGKVRDRPLRSHEYVFLLTKKHRYDFQFAQVVRDVWRIPVSTYRGDHFATMPEELVRRCLILGSKTGDVVLDPFSGSGTVAVVAEQLGRNSIGIDLKEAYVDMARQRLAKAGYGESIAA